MRSLERGEGLDIETDGQGTDGGDTKVSICTPRKGLRRRRPDDILLLNLGSPEPPGTCISVACMAWSKTFHYQCPHMHGHSRQGSFKASSYPACPTAYLL